MLFKLNSLEIEINLYSLYFHIPYIGEGFISRDQKQLNCFESWRTLRESEEQRRHA